MNRGGGGILEVAAARPRHPGGEEIKTMSTRNAVGSAITMTSAVAIGCLLPAAAATAGGGVEPLETVRVASGLNRPIYVTHAPGDPTRLYIVEQRGVIKVLDLVTGVVSGTPFLDIDALVAGPSSNNDERGLLGLAFHPDFANNNQFFLNYTNNSSDTTIRRYEALTPDLADASSGFTLLTIDQPQTNHNGGWIEFGPNDGYLYISTGDGGSGCDPHGSIGNSQDITNNLLGKMLRIDVDGGSPYAIPPDNPFVGITGDDEIWAYGLRNAWRNCFDRANGDLFIADVGQNAWEEINYQRATSSGGENYGWRCFEGDACSSVSGCPTTPCGCNGSGLVFPFQTYSHSTGFSITGGYVYRGCAIPSLDGHYFYADYVLTNIWSLQFDGSTISNFVNRTSELTPSADGFAINQIASFGEDAAGEIYIVDRGGTTSGQVFKIVPVTPVPNPDLDCDGIVGINDLLQLLAAWGPCAGCPEDLTGDGEVGIKDLLLLLAAWTP
jgi:glucose/arabinose dehydrogenase